MSHRVLVTGGAGFIGCHTSDYFAAKGDEVCVLDNLCRRGTESNLQWLTSRHDVRVDRVDIRDAGAVAKSVADFKPDVVIHLAGQVAVTTSVTNPREDFEINAMGTLNLLEAIRRQSPDTFVVYASTNKVYGKMESVPVVQRNGRYEYESLPTGIAESYPLEFYSPYGCSKGTADQYVLDYNRIYGIRGTSFRQSCIYGTRQFGIEDQGWVAWFSIASTLGKDISVYGDGKQIRDVLHVRDLVRAYDAAVNHQESAAGHAFNIGGGPSNTMSLLELLDHLNDSHGKKIEVTFGDWRPGDQKVFVCDTRKAKRLINWEPEIDVKTGVHELIDWVRANPELFAFLGS
jgi:CDP-paratose 2-epimerase